MRHLARFGIVAVFLALSAASAWGLEPAFGANCLGCHSQLHIGALNVIGYDTWADPDESATGAPDRGLLKCFQVYRRQTETLLAQIAGLEADDTYAVQLTRLRFAGVELNGRLQYFPDCDWPEWGDGAKYYTEPEIKYAWGAGPTTFQFDLEVKPTADRDYYDLLFAVAGKYVVDGGLFYAQEHFYVQVLGTPGDMNCDGEVDFDDINPFVLALIDRGQYELQYPDCNWHNADTSRDGKVDFNDINPFVMLLRF